MTARPLIIAAVMPLAGCEAVDVVGGVFAPPQPRPITVNVGNGSPLPGGGFGSAPNPSAPAQIVMINTGKHGTLAYTSPLSGSKVKSVDRPGGSGNNTILGNMLSGYLETEEPEVTPEADLPTPAGPPNEDAAPDDTADDTGSDN